MTEYDMLCGRIQNIVCLNVDTSGKYRAAGVCSQLGEVMLQWGCYAPIYPFSSFGVLGCVYVVFMDPCTGAVIRTNKITTQKWRVTVPDSEAGTQCRVLGSPMGPATRSPLYIGRVYREAPGYSRQYTEQREDSKYSLLFMMHRERPSIRPK